MRTKTLLLIAAAVAAGIATSQAQVFSVNAVGYVNTKVPGGGFALISNPLTAQTNTIAALFTGQVPQDFAVYFWDTGSKQFKIATFDTTFGWDPTDVAALNVNPGSGVFVKSPKGGSDLTITFVGEVPQGTLSTTLVPGLQIVASQVPQAGKLATDLGYTAEQDDKIYQWDSTKQAYNISTFDTTFGWDPGEPTVGVGEAFFLQKSATAKSLAWNRTFNVNQ